MYTSLYGLNHCKLSSAILDNRKFDKHPNPLEGLYQPQSIENRLKGAQNEIKKVEPLGTCQPLNGQLKSFENYSENYNLQTNDLDIKKSTHSDEDNSTCDMNADGVTNICGTNRKLAPILDPRFNLKQVSGNLLLLEDHLNNSEMRCNDCVVKHSNLISAYLQEANGLDKNREYSREINETTTAFNKILKKLGDKMKKGPLEDDECCEIAQEIRKIRKPLCQKYTTFGL
jgi:hypothetical protein